FLNPVHFFPPSKSRRNRAFPSASVSRINTASKVFPVFADLQSFIRTLPFARSFSATKAVSFFPILSKYRFCFHNANEQDRFTQNQPFAPSITSFPHT